jgi:carboxymethylenebutenolidase
MLPGIPPTGKYVELPHVVVMKFRGKKIVHEHIYWDQASLLAQIGKLDTSRLPIVGIEQSRRLQDISTKKRK